MIFHWTLMTGLVSSMCGPSLVSLALGHLAQIWKSLLATECMPFCKDADISAAIWLCPNAPKYGAAKA